MNNYISYTAKRTNIFVWLTVLLSLFSAVTRIIFFAGYPAENALVIIIRILLPIGVNLFLSARLLHLGSEMFYVTVNPVLAYAIYFACQSFSYSYDWWMITLCIMLCLVLALMYYMTFTGKFNSKWPALIAFIVPFALIKLDRYLGIVMYYYWSDMAYLLISDAAIYLSVLCLILSAKKLPPRKEGEPYRKQYGDRQDGRLIRGLTPYAKVSPYIMTTRNTSSNYINDRIEIGAMQRYVREKRKEGYKHFGITHVLIAAYVRCCNDAPAVNRFVAGQKVYSRPDIQINMIVKKDMVPDSPDTAIKLHCMPSDTATEIYTKFDELVQAVKHPQLDSDFDKLAALIDYIPGLIRRFAVFILRFADYFGCLPKELSELSPFHGSMFITSMGSLGIPPIYHHLYDFGNIPCFIAFGNKYTENELQLDGSVKQKKYIDFTVVTDERICDGFYYALVLKKLKSYLLHPERLDEKPEIQEDIY